MQVLGCCTTFSHLIVQSHVLHTFNDSLLPKVLEITSELDKAENYEKELIQKEKEVIKLYKEP